MRAIAGRSDTSSFDVCQYAAWQSSDGFVATIGSSGIVSAGSAGTTEISAQYQGIDSNIVTIEILAADEGTLEVNPPSGLTLDLWAGPLTGSLTASRVYTSGPSEDVTDSVTWIFGNPFIVSFDPEAGQAAAQMEGDTQVRVRSGQLESAPVPLSVLNTGPPTQVDEWMMLE